MSPDLLLTAAAASWATAGLASIGSKVLLEFLHHELEEYCERRDDLGRFDDILDHHEEVSMGVESLRVAAVSLAVLFGVGWLSSGDAAGGLSLTQQWPQLMIGAVLLIAGVVWIPLAVVKHWSAPVLYHTWRWQRAAGRLLWPVSLGAKFTAALLLRLSGRPVEVQSEEEAFEDEVRSIVTEGLREGHLQADAREMIEGVMELGDADVADIMTPRSALDAVDVDSPWDEVVAFVVECGRTRIPVFEGKLDRVLGILYAKDVLPELAKTPSRPLRALLREPWFVPQSKKVDQLLREFLRTHNHLAIVVDEYDAVCGVVTMEDALEEIVGEITDEYDEEDEAAVVTLNQHSAEVLGRAHMDEVNEQLGLKLPDDEEYDTIGGFILSRLGRLPHRQEEVQFGSVRITVLEVGRRRIERVRLDICDGASRWKQR